ncbi:olfactory receptor 10R2-like isoform X2 [Lithobates pipiens]
MLERNRTLVTEFLLLGFGNLHELRILLFILFLFIHINAVTGNFLVIILVFVSQSLHFPMYFFLSQLSLSEILFTTNIVPNMLWLILLGSGRVSVNRCISQLYFLGVPTVNQCLLLAAMSFDRHAAICNPLHYTIIMTFGHQVQIVLSCWLGGFTFSLVIYILLVNLDFCGPNIINHFYCDIAPVIELSCSDTSVVMLVTSLLSFPVLIFPFIFISATYISILRTILKIPSANGRQKTFSTCSSHLTIVCLYYGTLSFLYIFPPSDNSLNVNKGLSLLYTLLTPLFNPLIYSLRNHDIRRAIKKHIKKLS